MHSAHQSNSFSMQYDQPIYPYVSSSAGVDCTLSLATTSSRLTSDDYTSPDSRFCWDFLKPSSNRPPPSSHKSIIHAGATNDSAVDSLLARRCANCDTTSTPLWRNGPRGPKSLCNACGIRFKKEERRANASMSAAAVGASDLEGAEVYNGNMLHKTQAATHKLPSCYSPAVVGGEFRFIDDMEDRDSTFMSWRLNVTDRAGLVYDFTRY